MNKKQKAWFTGFAPICKGGPGSGNHGHGGRPGQRGGSSPKQGAPRDFSTKWSAARYLGSLPGAEQLVSVTGKEKPDVEFESVERGYEALKEEDFFESLQRLDGQYRQWTNSVSNTSLITQEKPDGKLLVNVY